MLKMCCLMSISHPVPGVYQILSLRLRDACHSILLSALRFVSVLLNRSLYFYDY